MMRESGMCASAKQKIPVAILGATGLVGQKAIAMVDRHPNFYVSEVAASNTRVGQTYGEAVCWRDNGTIPQSVRHLKLQNCEAIKSPYALSALPATVAKEVEPTLAKRGAYIFSNASAYRMDKSIPILIPEVNEEHLTLIEGQSTLGKIVTNSNCTTAFIALALKPLMAVGSIKHVSAVTMQAISGAGYPGMDSFDIMGNIIPYIAGEEDKIVNETCKILGTPEEPASFGMTVHVHRVPVLHGHTIALHIHFADEIDLDEAKNRFHLHNLKWPGLYHLYEEEERPQPARDITPYDQSAHIGRIKHGSENNILGLIVMGHNLVRGAAGASLRNMEATLEYLGITRKEAP